MSERKLNYSLLGKLLEYPRPTMKESAASCAEQLESDYPKIAPLLAPFVEYVQQADLNELEELYTKTFDIQAVCHLDIGYVLFGEDYKRGSFLVQIKREHEAYGNPYGPELPDYLPYVLSLLGTMSDRERADELVRLIVLPALEKMLQGFKKEGNVYRTVLEVVLRVLQEDYGQTESYPLPTQMEARP